MMFFLKSQMIDEIYFNSHLLLDIPQPQNQRREFSVIFSLHSERLLVLQRADAQK